MDVDKQKILVFIFLPLFFHSLYIVPYVSTQQKNGCAPFGYSNKSIPERTKPRFFCSEATYFFIVFFFVLHLFIYNLASKSKIRLLCKQEKVICNNNNNNKKSNKIEHLLGRKRKKNTHPNIISSYSSELAAPPMAAAAPYKT